MIDVSEDGLEIVIKGYRFSERIGTGGFGTVFRARQDVVDREVAIKVILPQFANHPDFIRRFETEAQIVARLEHPFIVPLYDYWREPGNAYLVMRYLRGGSLKGLIEQGPRSLEEGAAILEQISSALTLAHRNGVVHRDLKPENILLDEDNNIYLTDFGIAKDLETEDTYTGDPGAIIGSPMYLSPEQIKGEEVTPQSDIYSLGVVLYELLSGEKPFNEKSMPALLLKHLEQPLPFLSDSYDHITTAMDMVIQRATAKEGKERYSSPTSMARAFRRALDGEFPFASPTDSGVTRVVHRTVDIITQSTELPEPVNPYKGLRPFAEADAADFFGREVLVDLMVEDLSSSEPPRSNFLILVGPSGSGKSSAVNAGLIPALKRDALPNSSKWFFTEMEPGIHPLEELEAALLRVAVNPPESLLSQLKEDKRGLLRAVKRVLPSDEDIELLLYIDQFEELFTLCDDEAIRTQFMDMIIEVAKEPNSRLRIVTSLRADFYDRPLMYVDMGILVRQCSRVIVPMTDEEVQRVITGPAERVGVALEPQLTAKILADVRAQPGMLPLLQYALTELFEFRKGRLLRLQTYLERGGVQGALARRADDIFLSLDETGRESARQLFLRLVTLGEGIDDTRRRVLRSTLATLGPDIEHVISAFGSARLLTFDRDTETREPTVEVAHEALIREWARLRSWLDNSRDDVRTQRRLSAAAKEWGNADRDSSYLLTGFRLTQFEEWINSTDFSLSLVEADYFNASIQQRTKREADEAARKEREEKLERRSQNVLQALVVVAVLAAGISSVFALNARAAQRQAELRQQQNQSLNLATGAQLALADDDTDQAVILALAAATQSDEPPTQVLRSLSEAVLSPGTRRVYADQAGNITAVAFTFDGTRVLSSSTDGTVILHDRRTGQIIHELNEHDGEVLDIALDGRGSRALTVGEDGRVLLWDLQTGDVIREFEGHTTSITSVNFSPTAERLAAGAEDGTAIIWNTQDGNIEQRLENGHDGAITDLTYTPDGDRLITAGADAKMVSWFPETGNRARVYLGHSGRINRISVSADGSLIASAAAVDNAVFIWNVENGTLQRRLVGHADQPWDVAFGPTNERVATASQDGSVRIWDGVTGEQIARYLGHNAGVTAVAYSPDGLNILSGGQSGQIRLWDTKSGAELVRFIDHNQPIYSVDYSPDGRLAASGSWDTTLTIWDVQTNRTLRSFGQIGNINPDLGHTDWVVEVDFTSDGAQILSSSYDGRVLRWDVNSGEIVQEYDAGIKLWSSALTPDERLVAAGGEDGTLKLWDFETGELLADLDSHTGPVRGVGFNQDGTRLLSGAGIDQTVVVWDTASYEPLVVFEGHDEWLWHVQFMPDGERALSSSSDGQILMWNTVTGELMRSYVGHEGPVVNFDISPDGEQFISASSDTSVRSWDVTTGRELSRFSGHGSTVWSVALGPDAESAITGSGDTTARLWDISFSREQLIDFAQNNRYIRPFNCAEASEYELIVEGCDPMPEPDAE